ncbi:hypothetical protein HanRHA438_Chr07g0303561 [Helianthus annuus]|nr:hypothetical protein HanRHA438_Chr07g0303561 [Helianthus annuus]
MVSGARSFATKHSFSTDKGKIQLSDQQMVRCYWISLFLTFSCCLGVLHASVGDADPSIRSCLNDCEITGCVGEICFPHCNFSSNSASVDGPWYMQEPLYLRWKQWDCHSDCKYHCRSIGRKIEQHLVMSP